MLKYIIVSPIFSAISLTLLLYLIMKLSLMNKENNPRSKYFCLAAAAATFFLGGGSIILLKKLESTVWTVICLIVAAILTTGIVLCAKDIQNKIARRMKNNVEK